MGIKQLLYKYCYIVPAHLTRLRASDQRVLAGDSISNLITDART